MLARALAAVASMVAVVGCSRSTGADGTIALCVPDQTPEAASILVINAKDTATRGGTGRARVLIPLDVVTGQTGAPIDAGTSAECLGGVGEHVLVSTRLHGLHLRDPRTGAIVTTEAQLLGDAAGHVRESHYDPASHRLWVRTEFNDELVVDARTLTRWPGNTAPPVPAVPAEREGPPPIAPAVLAVPRLDAFWGTTAFYGGGDPAYSHYEASGRYGLACDGSKCRLATRQLDGYGNGGSLTPIPAADTLTVAHGVSVVPSVGVLISRLATLDKKSRELVLVGFDGKVRWTRPDLDEPVYATWQLDDRILVLRRTFESAPPNYASRVDVALLDARGTTVWAHTFPARRNWFDDELTEAVARAGNTVLVGANSEVLAMPLGPGPAVWHFDP
jgi:hypothetical protein